MFKTYFKRRSLIVLAAGLCFVSILTWARRAQWPSGRLSPAGARSQATTAQSVAEASHDDVARACGACHAYPAPEIFPRDVWRGEVERGFQFLEKSKLRLRPPAAASVVAYYEARAPEALPVLPKNPEPAPFSVRFERRAYREAQDSQAPGISNVRFVHLSDDRKLDVVACDMMNGKVSLLKPYEASPRLKTLTEAITNPAHAEVVDLNRDEIKDLVVADMGSAVPTEERLGNVWWLRGNKDGSFTPITLARELGRVTDVQAADFDGDGDLDLVVAGFGRLAVGETLVLENRTTDDAQPTFVSHTVDDRHGATHVPVVDLNHDGRPDFVVLISQEHETVVAFLNRGAFSFEPHTIYAAPSPAWGSTGIQVVDLDQDGDPDVLLSNGDTLDSALLRPYHGIRWLENRGSYPFEHHHLAALYGAHRAVAGDLDGDGDLDIVATSFMPGSFYQPLCREGKLDAIIILEQTDPGQFLRHSLETVTCDHATCDLGDFDGDGRLDFVTGNFVLSNPDEPSSSRPVSESVVLFRNLGSRTLRKSGSQR